MTSPGSAAPRIAPRSVPHAVLRHRWMLRRASPKRAPALEPCPPAALAEIRRFDLAEPGSPASTMHNNTVVRNVMNAASLDAELKGFMDTVFSAAHESSHEARTLGYLDIGAANRRGKRWAIERGAQLEALGWIEFEPTFWPGRRCNGFNIIRPRVPPAWKLAANDMGGGPPASNLPSGAHAGVL